MLNSKLKRGDILVPNKNVKREFEILNEFIVIENEIKDNFVKTKVIASNNHIYYCEMPISVLENNYEKINDNEFKLFSLLYGL